MAALPSPFMCVCVVCLIPPVSPPCLFCVCACGRGLLPQAAPGESTSVISSSIKSPDSLLLVAGSFHQSVWLFASWPLCGFCVCVLLLACVAYTSVFLPPRLRLPCLPRDLVFASSLPSCSLLSCVSPQCEYVLQRCHYPVADATSRHLHWRLHEPRFGSRDYAPPLPLALWTLKISYFLLNLLFESCIWVQTLYNPQHLCHLCYRAIWIVMVRAAVFWRRLPNIMEAMAPDSWCSKKCIWKTCEQLHVGTVFFLTNNTCLSYHCWYTCAPH